MFDLQLKHLHFMSQVLVHQPQSIGARPGFEQSLLLLHLEAQHGGQQIHQAQWIVAGASRRLTSAGACGCASSMAFVARSTIELWRASTSGLFLRAAEESQLRPADTRPRSSY